MTTGAALVAQVLQARGVSTVFGLCGDHTNPIFEAIDDAGIRIIDTRDERGAAWMAAGHALGTGSAGVCVVSNTPALTNAMTALADANASGHPVVCITGGVSMDDRETGHPGDQDQVAIAAPVVKHVARAEDPNTAGYELERAFHAATGGTRLQRAGAPGVSVVELPLDVQQRRAEDPTHLVTTLQALVPDPERIGAARALVASAQRPVIIAGSGCYWADAGGALRALAERARIPVFTARATRGLLSDDHELCMGFPNLMAEPAQIIFCEADVALVVGTKLDITLAGGAFHEGCRVIRADVRREAMQQGRAADVEIRGDAHLVLDALADGAQPRPTDAWIRRLREAADRRAEDVGARAALDQVPLHPGRVVAEVAAHLPPDGIVCVDAGELALWAIDAVPARAPASFHASSFSQLGALGMGLPWAIGLKVAQPDRPVLAIVGDGSFGFTAMELQTAVRHGIPIAVVVGNDAGWGIVRHLQQDLHGRALASDLPSAAYEGFADFAGAVGDRVETPQQLQIAIANALVSERPSLVNAIMDPSARHPAIEVISAMFRARDQT